MTRSKPIVFARSLLFMLLAGASVLVHATLIIFCSVFWRAQAYRLVISYGKQFMWLLKNVVGLDCVVHGRENIPKENAVVYLRHESVWETIAELVLFPQQCWVLKRGLMWVPFIGWALLSLKPIAIDRKARGTALEQVVRQGKQRLDAGLWVMIFPEGTRVAPHASRRYGLSGALLAREANKKILPVAHNAGDFWPRRSFMKYPGTVEVFIGPPIETYGRAPAAINRDAKAWIDGQLERLRGRPLHDAP